MAPYCTLNKTASKRPKGFLPTLAFLFIAGCGTSDPSSPGRCTTSSSSGYVAGATDTRGEKWSFELRPSDIQVRCVTPGASGVLQIVGIVRDAHQLPVATVAVGASVPEFGGLRMVTEENIEDILKTFQNFSGSTQKIAASDSFTDNCGVAIFTLIFTCPESADREVGGDFVAYSGPLFSEPANISVRLEEPPVIIQPQ